MINRQEHTQGPAATTMKFSQEIKADIKFKSAGPCQSSRIPQGRRTPTKSHHSWPSGSPATEEAQMAAAAALARLEQKPSRALGPTSQDSIRNQVRKELQAKATYSSSRGAPRYNLVPKPKEEISPHPAVSGVYFICPLQGVTLKREQRDAHIKDVALLHRPSCYLHHEDTFNRDRDRVKLRVDTTAKYLETSIFTQRRKGTKKIKLQSKVFQELIICLTHEFFKDIGFKKVTLPVPDQEGSEECYVLGEVARQPESLEPL